MKWMIASDIHGSALFCGQMFRRFEAERADRLILLGDLLYHGPRNDLPEGYAPKEVIRMLNDRADRLLCVRGNCEAEVDQMVLSFPVMADYALMSVGKRLIFITHGHVHNASSHLPLSKGDILLHGHTHVPAWEEREHFTCLNPGSVSIPKDGSERSYMILEENVFTWKTLEDGTVYHEYVWQN